MGASGRYLPDVKAFVCGIEVKRKGSLVQNWYGGNALLLQAFISKTLVINRSNPSSSQRKNGGRALWVWQQLKALGDLESKGLGRRWFTKVLLLGLGDALGNGLLRK